MLIRVVEPGELESRREDRGAVVIDPETIQARRASDPPLPTYWMAGFTEVAALTGTLDNTRPRTAWDRHGPGPALVGADPAALVAQRPRPRG